MSEELDKGSVFEYDVFISYRHLDADREYAQWLIHALETFRTPAALVKKGIPAKLKRVFRDEDELPTSADLKDDIKNALAASKFLVVICSRSTPKSRWVNQEVAQFREMGRGHCIIPLLIEGTPEESFPQALRELKKVVQREDGTAVEGDEDAEPLFADVRLRASEPLKTLKSNALLRILAHVLGCSYDELRRREHQRRMRRLRLQIGAIGAVVLLIAGGYLAWWDYTRVKVRYYRNITWRWGAPEGVGWVSRKFHSHRYRTWRLEERGGKVVRAGYVNSKGQLMDLEGGLLGVAELSIDYRQDGKVERIVQKDWLGKVVMVWNYGYGLSDSNARPDSIYIDLKSLDHTTAHQGGVEFNADAGFTNIQRKSKVSQHLLVLDVNGRTIVRRYRDYLGNNVCDATGSFGEMTRLEDAETVIWILYLNSKGEPAALKNGLMGTKQVWNKDGEGVSQEYIGPDGEPFIFRAGCAEIRFTYDSYGNSTSVSCFGLDCRPAILNEGYSKQVYEYDRNGNKVSQAFLGDNGSPVMDKYGYHKRVWTYDQMGNVTSEEYRDTVGNPALYMGGYSKIVLVNNSRGLQISGSYYGIDGKPAMSKDGCSSFAYRYDERNNRVQIECFDANGNYVVGKDGYAKLELKYHDKFNVVEEERYFDANENPGRKGVGYATRIYTYDERGNIIEVVYLDADDKPALNEQGVASERYICDDQGNCLQTEYFGIAGKPVTNKKTGYSKLELDYNESGDIISVAYFDSVGQPVMIPDGYSRAVVSRDERGNPVVSEFFGADSLPVQNSKRSAKIVRRYDDRGNMIEEEAFGIKGQPVVNELGISKYIYHHDIYNNCTEIEMFGTDGELQRCNEGFARMKQTFDAYGNKVTVEFLDVDGGAVGVKSTGIAKSIYQYDEKGDTLVKEGYDVNVRKTSAYDFSINTWQCYDYDENGFLKEISLFDSEKRPLLWADGYHKVRMKNDEHGNRTEVSYFDEKGLPVLQKDGYTRWTAKYNRQGKRTEVTTFGLDGKPVAVGGYASTKLTYDNQSNTTSEAFFGIDGKPVLNKDGYARTAFSYNARGELCSYETFGTEGKPVISNFGYAKMIVTHDTVDHVKLREFFNSEGAPFLLAEGYAKCRDTYDQSGNVTTSLFLGLDGKPVRTRGGYTRWDKAYDDSGKITSETFYDINGKQVVVTMKIFQVFPNTIADSLGMQPGDIFLRYGNWTIADTGALTLFFGEMDRCRSTTKTWVLLRGETLLTFDLPEGIIGAKIESKYVPESEHTAAVKRYQEFCRTGKQKQ
ncbi:MAG: toll/interleukin-1 receptor domain-containing protein [Chitinispirillaceae bacterium]|nr:toll/interleukin-1 receptor domain-containing protein [Chitinispirillaceae bacterium]